MTGRIFLKLILGVFGLLVVALVTVDYVTTQVAQDSYIQNLKRQLDERRLRVFLDVDTLRAGRDWPPQLGRAVLDTFRTH